jgi:hypothetical protein
LTSPAGEAPAGGGDGALAAGGGGCGRAAVAVAVAAQNASRATVRRKEGCGAPIDYGYTLYNQGTLRGNRGAASRNHGRKRPSVDGIEALILAPGSQLLERQRDGELVTGLVRVLLGERGHLFEAVDDAPEQLLPLARVDDVLRGAPERGPRGLGKLRHEVFVLDRRGELGVVDVPVLRLLVFVIALRGRLGSRRRALGFQRLRARPFLRHPLQLIERFLHRRVVGRRLVKTGKEPLHLPAERLDASAGVLGTRGIAARVAGVLLGHAKQGLCLAHPPAELVEGEGGEEHAAAKGVNPSGPDVKMGPPQLAPKAEILYPTSPMNPRAGTAVFIDHHEARVFHVALGSVDESTIQAPNHHVHRHPKRGTDEHNHPDDAHHFFAEVAKALAGSEGILLLGPSTAKLEFLRYVQKHDHALESHVLGIETVDHPSDKQLVAHIKAYFGIAAPRVS